MDTAEEYGKMLDRVDRLDIPTSEECRELLEKVFCVDNDIIRHGLVVAKVAVIIANDLNRAGYHLDIPLIETSCLLHDIAKGEPDHARLGALRLCEEGFAALAGSVAGHMDMKFDNGDPIGAEQILYLSDKMVMGERLVALEERFRLKQERYLHDPEILDRINGRLIAAQEIKSTIESALGRPLEEVTMQ
jgi:hypothetical protein